MRYIGYLLFSLPFLLMTAAMLWLNGVLFALLILAMVAAILGCMIGGIAIIDRSNEK